MAITEAQVHAAARRLDGEGQKVTVVSVRTALGSGSYSTIQRYLATYEPDLGESLEPMPDDLLPVLDGLWSRALHLAHEVSGVEVQRLNGELSRSRVQLDDLLVQMDQLQGDLDHLRILCDQITQDRDQAHEEISRLRGELAEMTGRYRALCAIDPTSGNAHSVASKVKKASRSKPRTISNSKDPAQDVQDALE